MNLTFPEKTRSHFNPVQSANPDMNFTIKLLLTNHFKYGSIDSIE
jgi:hypothetical protein